MTHIVDASYSVFNSVGGSQYNVSISQNSFDVNERIRQRLKPAGMEAYESDRPECLPGTRQQIRNDITRWATNLSSDKNILWIQGVAGSGESTLATTIANFFRDDHCAGVHLGAFLFFNRDVPERSHPGVVIPTLAYQLSLLDDHITLAIADAIDSTPNIRESPFDFQFRKLLVEPLAVLNTSDHTTVLVLDALDECGNPRERKQLLTLLAKETIKFPRAVGMIVASRAEPDICSAFESQSTISCWELDITTQTNATDIAFYIRSRMADIREARPYLPLASDWPGIPIINTLSDRALGLFVWASTAMAFIDAHDPRSRIEALLSVEGTPGVEAALDNLYETALKSGGRWDDEDFVKDFRAILGFVLVARTPLSADAIDNLRGMPEDRPSMHIISLLGCILSRNSTVRILHPSFSDFLSNRKRCGRDVRFIDITSHNEDLANLCLRRLRETLKYNICNLTLSSEVHGTLPEDVTYACIYWVEHICMVEDGAAPIAARAYAFLRQYFLPWVETMSILKRSRETIGLLYRLLSWFQHHWPTHADMYDFVYDTWRFVQTFADPIEDHPLLVYMTALPFTPTDSPICMGYLDTNLFPHNSRDSEMLWSPNLLVLSRHEGPVSSVSFSTDGLRVVSGSHDKTIRVWSASSGVELLPPLRGHEDFVCSVAFSIDGLRLVSSSRDCTIRVWSTTTGVETLSPLQGHHGWVTSASFSPDGTRIVSASHDCTIRVWNSTSGEETLPPFEGHESPVTSVAYSFDGTRIVSGSQDQTVRVWDAASGTQILQPLRGHHSPILSVCFSLEDNYILSGSYDGSISMWDITSDEIIPYYFMGHEKSVNSAVFSSDCKFVISGSDDYTIRLWDVISRRLFATPLRGHGDRILSLSFHSGNGMRIASGSADNTVRIWEVRDLDVLIRSPHMRYRWLRHHSHGTLLDSIPLLSLPQAHQSTISSLAFSPDGTRVASSSQDLTICISDTNAPLDFFPTFRVREPVQHVMFSPDGEYVVSVSIHEFVQIWDIESGKEGPALYGGGALGYRQRYFVCIWIKR